MKNTANLFKTKRFLPLFITQFFGAFNDNAFKNAFLIWLAYDFVLEVDIDIQIMVTLAAGLFILPFFLFSATAGQVADKYEKSWLTQKIKQVEMILMVLCAVCFFFKSIYGLMLILFMMGVQSTFFGPIKYSLLPEHLKNDELVSGNGLIEGGTFLSILLGTIFGGLVIRTEYGVELLSLSIIIFSIAGWLSSRFIPKSSIGDKNLKISFNIISQTLKIIQYARVERSVWLSIIGISWFWLIGATFLTQFPIYTKEIISGNEHVVTLFLTIFSMGVAIGSVMCNSLLKGQINGRFVPYGLLGITASIFLFFWMSYLYEPPTHVVGVMEFFETGYKSWFILASLLLLSVFSGIYIVPLYAIMQHRSDGKYLARIIAANNVVNAFFMVVSSAVTMILYKINFDVIEIFLVIGFVNLPVFFVIRGVVNRRLTSD